MILAELKTYLTRRKRASLVDMALHFNSDPDAVRGMLDHYIRKGRVRRLDTGTACGGCHKCDALSLEIYEWTESMHQPDADSPSANCQIARALP
ncbi:MAG: sugar metabolism transcriptional regulator [Rhodobacteraceae bacterium]|nr:sugar metabolism transcriptional regulator [Paracoccaceae bacterium]